LPAGQTIGDVAGLALIVLGGAMMVLSAARLRRTAPDIDSMVAVAGGSGWCGLVLTALLLGAVLGSATCFTRLFAACDDGNGGIWTGVGAWDEAGVDQPSVALA